MIDNLLLDHEGLPHVLDITIEIVDDNDWNLNLTDIILGVFQEYKDHFPHCNREENLGRNLIEDSSLWITSIPHPEKSGKCFTYKYKPNKTTKVNSFYFVFFFSPKGTSSPGDCYSLR